MMQSHQVTDEILAQALVSEYYQGAVRLASFLLHDDEAAREITEQSIHKIVAVRHRFWGEESISSLLYSHILALALKHPSLEVSRGHADSGSDLTSLERNQALVILLRYGLHQSLEDTARVIERPRQTAVSLFTGAYRHLLAQDPDALAASTVQGDDHQQARESILRAAAGDDTLGSYGLLHIENCPACRSYRYAVENLERRLPASTDTAFPSPQLPPEKLEVIGSIAHSHIQSSQQKRKLAVSSKEALLIGFVIVAVLIAGWVVKAAAPDEGFSNRGPATPISEIPSSIEDAAPLPDTSGSVSAGAQSLEDSAYLSRRGYASLSRLQVPMTRKFPLDALTPAGASTARLSGPLALQAVLYYWGEHVDTYLHLQRAEDDPTATQAELISYVTATTDLKVIQRFAGNTDLLDRLTRAGFPVIIQRGSFSNADLPWSAQYDIVFGVDKTSGETALASLIIPTRGVAPVGLSDRSSHRYIPIVSNELYSAWHPFNYAYLVVYPADQEEALKLVLGDQFDAQQNYLFAANLAQVEAHTAHSSKHLFYDFYNLGNSLLHLSDEEGAAAAFDQAYAVFRFLPPEERIAQILWYQPGPYQAYFSTGRYGDLISLASTTIQQAGDVPVVESYYWRALARAKLGDWSTATNDLQTAMLLDPDFSLVPAAFDSLNGVE
jgi:DNA-directed RNA polymerase specialized sigma24 family protein